LGLDQDDLDDIALAVSSETCNSTYEEDAFYSAISTERFAGNQLDELERLRSLQRGVIDLLNSLPGRSTHRIAILHHLVKYLSPLQATGVEDSTYNV